MKEIQEIIKAYGAIDFTKQQAALATVVYVEGSSYRRQGARMLITDNGKLTGTISGGCLEGDALRKASLVMMQQKPMLVTYDTRDEDDAKLGMQLGCNGVIHILIEPIHPADTGNPIHLLKNIVNKRQNAVLLTLFSLTHKSFQLGTCLLKLATEKIIAKTIHSSLQEALLLEADRALALQSSTFKNFRIEEKEVTAFIEFIPPPVSLMIAGAGNDIIPVVQMAHILGWQTTVMDGRPNYATAERFPVADKVIVAKPKEVFTRLTIDLQTIFLLMTHNYNYDLAMLRELVQHSVVYTGILGPGKKLDRMLAELKEEGLSLSEAQRSTLYAPVGLDMNAETSEEIALSIIAEIKVVLSNRSGQFLKNKKGSIHTRPVVEEPERFEPSFSNREETDYDKDVFQLNFNE